MNFHKILQHTSNIHIRVGKNESSYSSELELSLWFDLEKSPNQTCMENGSSPLWLQSMSFLGTT